MPITVTDKQLRRWYKEYNKAYFHDLLPDLPVYFTNVGFDCMAQTEFDSAGATEIKFSPFLQKVPRYCAMVMLHEQCHVSVGNKEKTYHGKLWRDERKRLLDSGAFTRLI